LVAEDPEREGHLQVLQPLNVSDSTSIADAVAEHASIFTLVNSAGVGLDLPWCTCPLATSVSAETRNFTGVVEVCEAEQRPSFPF